MATERPQSPPRPPSPPSRESAVGRHVLDLLGRPDDLHSVQVRSVGEGRYRVNVMVRLGDVSAQIAHSYFITADDAGRLLTSAPAIRKQYADGGLPPHKGRE